MRTWIVTVFFVTMTGILAGCASNNLKGDYVTRKNINAPVEGIIKAFDRVTIGLRGRSPNGREVVSKYQAIGKGVDEYNDDGASSKKRAYARLRILGDRRPYDLQMQVVTEEDDGEGGYEVTAYDDEKAARLLKKLLETLVARPDNKDFIDDFRSF